MMSGSEETYQLMRVEFFPPLLEFWDHGSRASTESAHEILPRLEFSQGIF